MAQLCDSPVDTDGMWERCLTAYHRRAADSPTEIDCYTMSAGDPPKEGDPILQRHQHISTRSLAEIEVSQCPGPGSLG